VRDGHNQEPVSASQLALDISSEFQKTLRKVAEKGSCYFLGPLAMLFMQLQRYEKGGNIMTENKQDEGKEQKNKKKKTETAKPFCTTAPSAEHARATDEDEPCDDSSGEE
jgi:hypothetical protein